MHLNIDQINHYDLLLFDKNKDKYNNNIFYYSKEYFYQHLILF